LAASEARALGDIMSESMGGIISECPGDFIGIRTILRDDFLHAHLYVVHLHNPLGCHAHMATPRPHNQPARAERLLAIRT
ncbi:hypothetical protein, partial [Nitrobacter vulgaris]|uniref:hypothetical protein n=1 Tax=Nitrobacter vulgaris TaxID=29421 RepID=UPI001AED0702